MSAASQIIQAASADEPAPLWFDIDARGGGPNPAPRVQPWCRVPLDAQHAGAWVVAGDLTGDGLCEIVVGDGAFDHRGRRVATLALPDGQTPWIIMAGDINGINFTLY